MKDTLAELTAYLIAFSPIVLLILATAWLEAH
jgi:hypothetical protein